MTTEEMTSNQVWKMKEIRCVCLRDVRNMDARGKLEMEALTVVAVIVYEDNFFDEMGRTLLQNTAARGSGVKRVLLRKRFTLCTLNKWLR